MKVNLNKCFVDCFGKNIEGKNIAEQLSLFLFNLSSLAGSPLSAENRYLAYCLCNRISSCPSTVELTTEEASFIKEVANEAFSAGAYGQIVDIIEGKKNIQHFKHEKK